MRSMSTARRQTRLARSHLGGAPHSSVGLALWRHFEAGAWDEARALLHSAFVAHWPQSDERFRGPDNFVAVNRAHPAAGWRLVIHRVVETPEASALQLTLEHVEGTDHGACFYVVRRGRILEATELWAERTSAPGWRASWAQGAPSPQNASQQQYCR
jgi:SnoaL-like protein